MKQLYLQKKKVKTDKEYLKIKKRIGELSSHPKSYIDKIPSDILSKKTFFARKFYLSNKELYLKYYKIKNLLIISGLQRSGNHLFIKLLVESIDKKVLFINNVKKNLLQKIYLMNLFLMDII